MKEWMQRVLRKCRGQVEYRSGIDPKIGPLRAWYQSRSLRFMTQWNGNHIVRGLISCLVILGAPIKTWHLTFSNEGIVSEMTGTDPSRILRVENLESVLYVQKFRIMNIRVGTEEIGLKAHSICVAQGASSICDQIWDVRREADGEVRSEQA